MMGIDYKVRDAVEALNLKYIRALDRRDMQGWLATFDNPGTYVCIPKENEGSRTCSTTATRACRTG